MMQIGRMRAPVPLLAGRKAEEPAAEVARLCRFAGLAWGSMLVVALTFGSFGAWSALAPLPKGALGTGYITVETISKTIQHLEGGIVGAIEVVEGDRVEKGQVLVRLDRAQAEAALDRYRDQLRAVQARQAYLRAIRDDLEAPPYRDWLLGQADRPQVAELVAVTDAALAQVQAQRRGQEAILVARIGQLQKEIAGFEIRSRSLSEQGRLLALEIEDMEYLNEKKLALRPELLRLKRQLADMEGRIAANLAEAAQAGQEIAETRLRIADLGATARAEASTELQHVAERTAELEALIRGEEDVLARADIRAPEAGVISNLRIHTIGGVIGAGQPILDLVPSDEDLVVSARLRPVDVEGLYPGLPARVTLRAYSARSVPTLDGTLSTISADRIEDERTGESYFLARVRIDRSELAGLDRVQLQPGMPVDVMIVSGERTVLDYVLDPFLAGTRRAFID
jgi:HlyD family type I secretion membrane fusion protein